MREQRCGGRQRWFRRTGNLLPIGPDFLNLMGKLTHPLTACPRSVSDQSCLGETQWSFLRSMAGLQKMPVE
ncbi:MAG: hypothetical protein ACI814_003351 [Mariniblastus sp.]|jgi:hypothetical protein